jgi:signal transduction histidine kinase
VKRLVEESIQKTRNLSHELSPTLARTAGLVEALSWLARNLEEQLGLKVELAAETIPDPENPSLKTFLYRAAHELLFNTFKHAQVETARVSISKKDDRLTLTVSDHGKGFDPALTASSDTSTGLGLLSIRERARFFRGNLEIESEPDQGSRFVLTVPVA